MFSRRVEDEQARVAGFRLRDRFGKRVDHRFVQCVRFLGPVQGDSDHALAFGAYGNDRHTDALYMGRLRRDLPFAAEVAVLQNTLVVVDRARAAVGLVG